MIARVITGIVAFGAVVGALVLGANLEPADPGAHDPATVVAVTPARQDVVCTGPLVTPSGGTGTDPELGGAATGVTAQEFVGGDSRPVGEGTASDAIVGAQIERVSGGDITGIGALTCVAPSTDQWIVAGATTIGSSARLVLTNPGEAALEATITAYGEIGELDTRVVAIGPNAQEEILLEGVVVDVSSLAIHIVATGTGVVAALQDSRLDGFQPFGVDWAGPSALGEQLAIPGIGNAGSSAQSTRVRIVAPEGATARLSLSTLDGAALWEGVADLRLEAGVAVEVDVPAVDVGTVVITADAPVAAAAMVTRTRTASAGVEGDLAREFAWIPAQPANDELERTAVTVGYDSELVVFAHRRATFTATTADGEEVGSLALAPGTTGTLPLDVPPGTVIVASGPFTWGIRVADGNFLTALAPTRTTVDPADIAVELRRYVPIP